MDLIELSSIILAIYLNIIQNIITMASKLVYQGRQWKLKVTGTNKWLLAFARLYNAFSRQSW